MKCQPLHHLEYPRTFIYTHTPSARTRRGLVSGTCVVCKAARDRDASLHNGDTHWSENTRRGDEQPHVMPLKQNSRSCSAPHFLQSATFSNGKRVPLPPREEAAGQTNEKRLRELREGRVGLVYGDRVRCGVRCPASPTAAAPLSPNAHALRFEQQTSPQNVLVHLRHHDMRHINM